MSGTCCRLRCVCAYKENLLRAHCLIDTASDDADSSRFVVLLAHIVRIFHINKQPRAQGCNAQLIGQLYEQDSKLDQTDLVFTVLHMHGGRRGRP